MAALETFPLRAHFSTFLVILSLSHKTGNQQTSSPRKLLASHLLIWNFSLLEAASKEFPSTPKRELLRLPSLLPLESSDSQ